MTSRLKARPTVYRGIRMRSRLEAGFAAWLDENHFAWEYEPYAFGSPKGQYLPDFRLTGVFASWCTEPVTVYVEVKPENFQMHRDGCFVADPIDKSEAKQNAAKLATSLQIIMQSEPDALLVLAQQGHPLEWIAELNLDGAGFLEYFASPLQLIVLPEKRLGVGHVPFCRSPWAREYWKPTR